MDAKELAEYLADLFEEGAADLLSKANEIRRDAGLIDADV